MAQSEQTPWQEWAAAAIGGALVAGVLSFLLYQALTRPDTPPQITAQALHIQPAGQGWLVELRVFNQGYRTAAGLNIAGELQQDNQTIETSSTTLDYVPGRSARRAGLFFRRDPRQFKLELKPQGYQQP